MFTPYQFGHLEIIGAKHLANPSDYPFSGFGALFMRYAKPYLQWYWQVPFALFAIVVLIALCVPRLRKKYSALIIASISFFLFITFTALHLPPLVLVENFINRYFYAVMGFVCIGLSVAVVELAGNLKDLANQRANIKLPRVSLNKILTIVFGAVSLLGVVGMLGMLTTPVGQRFGRYFAWDPRDISTRALWKNQAYRFRINQALQENTPILATNGNAGSNAAQTVLSYFVDFRDVASGDIHIGTVQHGGQVYTWVSSNGAPNITENQPILALLRGPFEVTEAYSR